MDTSPTPQQPRAFVLWVKQHSDEGPKAQREYEVLEQALKNVRLFKGLTRSLKQEYRSKIGICLTSPCAIKEVHHILKIYHYTVQGREQRTPQ